MKKKNPTIAVGYQTIDTLNYLISVAKKKGLDANPFESDPHTVLDCLEGISKALSTQFFNTHALPLREY